MALVSAFYEAFLVRCPNLKMLTVENSVVRLNEMVETSTRLNRWTIERLSISADSSEQVGLFAGALAESSYPISKTLSCFSLEAKVEDVGALYLLIQATARMKRSQTLKITGIWRWMTELDAFVNNLRFPRALDRVYPVPHRSQLAFLSVLAATDHLMERAVAELIFAHAADEVHHWIQPQD